MRYTLNFKYFTNKMCTLLVLLRLKQLVATLPPRRTGFDFVLIHVRFWHIMVPRRGFLKALRFSPVYIIPSMLHTYIRLHAAMYMKDKRANLRTLHGTSALSEIAKHE